MRFNHALTKIDIVENYWFVVLINVELKMNFHSTREVRQRDLISPALPLLHHNISLFCLSDIFLCSLIVFPRQVLNKSLMSKPILMIGDFY